MFAMHIGQKQLSYIPREAGDIESKRLVLLQRSMVQARKKGDYPLTVPRKIRIY